jgi:hypothetical protein
MLVVRAMLGAAAEVIKMVYVEMVTHRFVPEWIDQNVSVMLGAVCGDGHTCICDGRRGRRSVEN